VVEIKRLVRAFAELGTSKVRITGGEPALRKDLTTIIETVRQTQGIASVALTTNGFSLKRDIDDWHKAGLNKLNVSIDSLHPHQFTQITGSTKLPEILRGLDRALELGLNVKVNAVLLKQFNANEVSEFLSWLRTTPITLRFIELMRTGDNQAFFEQQHVSGEKLLETMEKAGWLPILKTKDAGPAKELFHPEYQGRLGFIMPYSKGFCSSCNRLRVSALGNLHQCLFAEEGQSLRHLLGQDDQLDALKSYLQAQLTHKAETHGLHEHNPGATRHLAMLGG
jgi:cyclic pyranopterin phosphate synthase